MRIAKRALLLLALIPVVVGAVLVTRPLWSSPVAEAQDIPQIESPGLAAMHAVCLSGDQDAMRALMDAMTEEDWQAMRSQMQSGHASMMGEGMMGG